FSAGSGLSIVPARSARTLPADRARRRAGAPVARSRTRPTRAWRRRGAGGRSRRGIAPTRARAVAHGLHGIVASVSAALKTTLTELGDSRVRLQVEVPPAELEGRLKRKARQT